MTETFKLRAYIIIISTAALLLLLYFFTIWDPSQFVIFPLLVFLFLNAATESTSISLPQGLHVSVSFATIFASMLLFQPLEVAVLTALGYLFSLGKERSLIKYAFNTSQLVLCSGLSVLFIQKGGGVDLSSLGLGDLVTLFVAASIYYLVNAILVTIVVSITQNEVPYVIFLSNISWATPNFLCLAPLGLLVAIIFEYVGGWGLLLFFIPLLMARHSFKSYMDMRQSFLDTIHSLTKAIDAKDAYTRGHSSRVADYSEGIAKELGYSIKKLEMLRYISLLHDCGKIGVKEHILNKPGRLDEEEFREMQRHSELGASIIGNVGMLAEGVKIVRHHHERFDGGGYPDGIKGPDIPEGARIICVADAFDAMTTNRPYRRAMTPEEAMEELNRCSGSQFDPRIVEAFIKAYPRIQLAYPESEPAMAEAAAAKERENPAPAGGA